MRAVKNHYWDEICALGEDDEAQMIEAALSRDVEGRTEFNLREAIAESIRVCGREYTKEIIDVEMNDELVS